VGAEIGEDWAAPPGGGLTPAGSPVVEVTKDDAAYGTRGAAGAIAEVVAVVVAVVVIASGAG